MVICTLWARKPSVLDGFVRRIKRLSFAIVLDRRGSYWSMIRSWREGMQERMPRKEMSNKIKLDLDWFHFTLDSFSLLSFSLSWLVSISPVTLGISSGTLAPFFPSYIRLDHADAINSCIAVAPCSRATSFISFFMWGYLDNIIGMVVCSQSSRDWHSHMCLPATFAHIRITLLVCHAAGMQLRFSQCKQSIAK